MMRLCKHAAPFPRTYECGCTWLWAFSWQYDSFVVVRSLLCKTHKNEDPDNIYPAVHLNRKPEHLVGTRLRYH